jgi:sRNA-binding regulator protein Hfq
MENKFNIFKGKKVYVILINGRKYTGAVKETTDRFVFILDKFNQNVTVRVDEISSLEEER